MLFCAVRGTETFIIKGITWAFESKKTKNIFSEKLISILKKNSLFLNTFVELVLLGFTQHTNMRIKTVKTPKKHLKIQDFCSKTLTIVYVISLKKRPKIQKKFGKNEKIIKQLEKIQKKLEKTSKNSKKSTFSKKYPWKVVFQLMKAEKTYFFIKRIIKCPEARASRRYKCHYEPSFFALKGWIINNN